jgi:Icc-related predicted phosphoesterase
MKISIISDTHTKHRYCENDLPGGDLLIHAGDFMNSGYNPTEAMEFFKWFDEIDNYDTKVLIAGNHDRWMQDEPEEAQGILTGYKTIEYLQDEEMVLYNDGPNGEFPEDNIRIYGSPWQPEFYNWAFNLIRGSEEMKAKWDAIPSNTDILVTHGPPFGHLDIPGEGRSIRVGCETLRFRIDEIRPKIHVFGHIHECGGMIKDETEVPVKGMVSLNASLLNIRYVLANPIWIWDTETNDWSSIEIKE